MGKFDGMLLVSDYDNTFQYTESALSGGGAEETPPPPARNLEAAAYWTAEGGRFAIATGRALGAIRRQAEKLPINAAVIVDNGGGIYDLAGERYILRKLLPDRALEDLAEVEAAFPGTSMELYLSDERIHALHPTQRNIQHALLTGMPFREIGGLNRDTIPVPLAKALFMADMPQLQKLQSYMSACGWEERYEMIFSSDHLMELTAKGADKGVMARELKRLTASRTLICIGDHANDLPMLQAADRAFAPANAIEAVRTAKGVTVVCHCLEGAVADVVERVEQAEVRR
ncbi:MAG: HAD-IIB family hydrolase [Oscillospiraceae bacterium]|nr:HAD-IIB family hydrolase [Oscillospiraceae bacterium]